MYLKMISKYSVREEQFRFDVIIEKRSIIFSFFVFLDFN